MFPQAPFVIVHWNTFWPTPIPLTTEVALLGVAIVPEPLTKLQAPVAGATAAFAVSVALDEVEQAFWSAPALAAAWPLLLTTMDTSSKLTGFAQAPLLIVQRNTLTPIPRPVTALVGTLALSYQPLLWVVAAVMVAERVAAFSLSSPATKVMYTLAAPADKYKVQSFIDTVVYRGGDAAAGWLFALIGAGAGFASAAIPAAALPLALLWLWNSVKLGGLYETKSSEAKKETAAGT